jgi:hypothetical protein
VRENATFAIVDIAESDCAAGVFAICASDHRCPIDVVATHRCRLTACRADSESRFLAMKKFSRPPALRLIGARQNRFFEGIAAADSRRDFSSGATYRGSRSHFMRACT